jgi:phosphatidylserine/phosphatidylglycerophosphate/cardiolipin synthase-like enzyme
VKPGPPREAFEQLRKIFGSTSGFEAMVSGNRVTLLHDGEQAFPAMLEAIAKANREILLEMYWFASDQVGRQFADALVAKAEAGAKVRVIYDAVGSIQSDRRMFARLRDAGCEVLEYNPIAPWRARFREPQTVVRPRLQPPVDSGDGQGSRVRVLANHYSRERRAIRQAYLRQIESAQRSVCITNSYFVPDGQIRRVLGRAVNRGAEVRVIVPGKSDVPVVRHAARKLHGRLLEAGIQLYEWQGSILHSKTAVIDGRWCTVGTYNLDARSLRFNLEVVAAVEDGAIAGAMEDRFNEDLEHTRPVSLEEWRRRPLHVRMLDEFFYRFHRLL